MVDSVRIIVIIMLTSAINRGITTETNDQMLIN